MFIYWDCKILSGTATFHKRGVLDCNFQNPSEIPDKLCETAFEWICVSVPMPVSNFFTQYDD